MKQVAVVGFHNSQEFRDWFWSKIKVGNKDHYEGLACYTIGKNLAIDEKEHIAYHCILCKEDIAGNVFDDIIECDPLRLELRLRLRSNKDDNA